MLQKEVAGYRVPLRSLTFWAVVGGLAISLSLPYQNLRIEQRRKMEAARESAAGTFATISPYLVMNLANLTALQAFFGASEEVTEQEFRQFNEELENLYPVPHRTGYVRRVAAAGRDAFEASMQASYPGFAIREMGPDRSRRVAASRPEYYPVTMIADMDPGIIGVDLGAEESIARALALARDTGKPAISEPFTPPGSTSRVYIITAPVYVGGGIPAAVDARRNRLAGFVAISAQLGEGIRYVLEQQRQTDPHVLLYASNTPDSTPGYVHANRAGEPESLENIESMTFGVAMSHFQAQSYEIDFAGRTFFIVLLPSADLRLLSGIDITDIASLILGLLGTFLLGGFIRRREEFSAAVQRSAAIHDAMVRSAADAFIGMDEEGRVTDWSPQAESLFGWKSEEILGKDVFVHLVPEPLIERGRAVLAEFLRTGDSPLLNNVTEERFMRRDGRDFVAQRMMTATRLDGRYRFLAFVRDLSESRQTQAQLQQAQKMEAIGQLTGGLAHDFNNLLGVVIGNLDMLKLQLADNDKALKKADVALGAAERGAKLTRALLAVARKQLLDPKEQDVNAVIRELEPLLVHSAGKKINVSLELCEETVTAKFDAGGLESSALNLIVNARDAMPGGGQIVIRTRIRDAGPDISSVLKEGSYVVISVADTGCGMPPADVARAFEPFFTTKERGRGTGLGLPMVYGFARQSGGDARIYSEPGRGTTVNIYLPLTAPAAGAHDKPVEAEPVPLRGDESILLVDDETDLRALTAEWLGQLGYRVTAVDSPQAALAIMESGVAFDLLLTDVIMPGGVDGVALVKKARERMPGFPALLISGFMDMQVGTELPCEVLQKPFRQPELARAVRRALATSGQVVTPPGDKP
jgi:PAS domain S-box-containing protein